jgi:hypothetical protein
MGAGFFPVLLVKEGILVFGMENAVREHTVLHT